MTRDFLSMWRVTNVVQRSAAQSTAIIARAAADIVWLDTLWSYC
jgi:hypothetical protein